MCTWKRNQNRMRLQRGSCRLEFRASSSAFSFICDKLHVVTAGNTGSEGHFGPTRSHYPARLRAWVTTTTTTTTNSYILGLESIGIAKFGQMKNSKKKILRYSAKMLQTALSHRTFERRKTRCTKVGGGHSSEAS